MKLSELIKEQFDENECYFIIYQISGVLFRASQNNLEEFELDSDDVLDCYVFNEDKQVRRYNKKNIVTLHNTKDNNLSFIEKCKIDSKAISNNNEKFKYVYLCNNFSYNENGILFVESTTYYKLER